MKTTSLFVEILIIGSGLFTWMALLVFSILGVEWLSVDFSPNNLLFIPLLAIFYVLGIAWDRMVDLITDIWDKPLRKQYFSDSDTYHKAKDLVYSHSESIKDLFEYTRSRMRICRSWMIDWFIIFLIFPFFISSNNLVPEKLLFIIVFEVLFLTFSTITFFSWRKLTSTFYERLRKTYETISAR